jgi:hypothetical protein
MRLKTARGIAVSATIIVGMLLTTSGVAFAQGIAIGNVYNYTDGYKYDNQNTIDTTAGRPAVASINVATQNGGNVPAGYMGVKAMMFYSNGSLCRAGSWTYNGSSTFSMFATTSPGCGSGPVYYSQGASAAYNGHGYDTFPSWPSPDENS